jgi:uncharacterized protein YndB with AHSA1/START domain
MIDVASQINAVQRTVGSRTVNGSEAKTVVVSQTYDTAIEDVWNACTTAERISRWLMPISGELRLGGRYQLEGNAGGTIEECEPPQRLAVTWEYGGDTTWVEARLVAAEHGQTTVQVEHIARVDQERWEEFGPGAVGIGWDSMLLGLALHLRGEGMSGPEEAAVWAASDEGREFMRQSGEGWHDAHAATGEDAAMVRAAADRCITAYTAEAPEEAPSA